MKIRNGFVSNSSSSSFLLLYNKKGVTTDPAEVVRVINETPNIDVIINGGEYGEGDDVFKLSSEQKSLIRKFSKEFIKLNTGLVDVPNLNWDEEKKKYFTTYHKEPRITAYFDGELAPLREDYDLKHGYDPEKWEESRKEEIEKISNEARENFVKQGICSAEDFAYEEVPVSYYSCDNDGRWGSGDFSERYLTWDDAEDYFGGFHPKKYSKTGPRSFAIIYESLLQDIEDIFKEIESNKGDSTLKIARYNKIFSESLDVDTLDLYNIGEKEKELLIKNKDKIIEFHKEYILFKNAEVITNASILENVNRKKIIILYGNLYEAAAGSNIPDFKDTIIGGK